MANAEKQCCGQGENPSGQAAPSGETVSCPRFVRFVALGAVAIVTLLVTWLVAGHWWEIGIKGPPYEWTWPYYKNAGPVPWLLLVPPLFCGGIIIAVACVAVRRGLPDRRKATLFVAVLLAAALGLTLTLPDAGPFGGMDAVPVTVNPWVGGYYAESVHVQDAGGYVRDYPERISKLEVVGPFGHLSDHPVGPVLFHVLVNRTMEASPGLRRLFLPADAEMTGQARALTERVVGAPVSDGQLAGIWASAFLFRLALWLTLIPVYLLGRELHSREAGLLGAALTAFIPALHLFGPYPDQIFPFILVFSLYAWVRAVRGRSMGWAAASAATVFFGLLWSMALLIAAACIGLASLLMLWQERARPECKLDFRAWGKVIAVWAAAFLLSVLILRLLFGYHVVEVWRLCLSKHAGFALAFPRSRWLWTAFNPVEFAVFCGVPSFLLLLLAAGGDVADRFHRRVNAPAMLIWTVLGVLAALDLSGKNLGEVARLWMMLMPSAALAGASALASLDRGRGWMSAVVLLLSLAQLVVFKLHLDVFMVSGM